MLCVCTGCALYACGGGGGGGHLDRIQAKLIPRHAVLADMHPGQADSRADPGITRGAERQHPGRFQAATQAGLLDRARFQASSLGPGLGERKRPVLTLTSKGNSPENWNLARRGRNPSAVHQWNLLKTGTFLRSKLFQCPFLLFKAAEKVSPKVSLLRA